MLKMKLLSNTLLGFCKVILMSLKTSCWKELLSRSQKGSLPHHTDEDTSDEDAIEVINEFLTSVIVSQA